MNSNRYVLCGNCVHQGQCVLEGNGTHAVIFCEEFVVEPFQTNGVEKRSQQGLCNDQPVKLNGLCSTCDHANHCAFVSTESVILNCELYQ